MKRKFVIDQLISLEGKEFYYDLHNCYDFEGIELTKNITNDRIDIFFHKTKGDWVKNTDPGIIVISFRTIRYLFFSNNFFNRVPKDIDEIGYKDEDDQNYDYIQGEEQANDNSHMFLRFGNGEFLRIYADEVIVKVDNI